MPKRQKTFLSTLAGSISTSLGTGSSCIQFSTDSDRLYLSSAFESTVVAIELRQEEDSEVVAVFGAGRKAFEDKKKQANGDVEMNGHASDPDGEEDSEAGLASVSPQSSKGPGSIVAMTVSDDGKWLATADLERTVEVYDLEQRKVRTLDPLLVFACLIVRTYSGCPYSTTSRCQHHQVCQLHSRSYLVPHRSNRLSY